MRRRRQFGAIAVALCCFGLVGVPAWSAAAGTEMPEPGPYKGKTKQGFPVYFRLTEDRNVTNIRFTYRESICGKQSVHDPTASLSLNGGNEFAGTIYSGRLEFKGAFVSPTRVQGKLVAFETTGLPGCLRKVVAFTAYPRG